MHQQTSLEQRLVALEDEVARLKGVDEIKQLLNKYGYMLDKCYYDDIPALFVLDDVATPEIYHDGAHYVGGEGVRRGCDFFKQCHAAGKKGPAPKEFVDHVFMQHVVTVLPGNEKAFGRARILVQMARHKDHEAGPLQLWGAGLYENEYIRVGGRWMFRKINLNIYWSTSFDEGWAMANERSAPPPRLFPEDPYGPDEIVDHGTAMWPASTRTFPFHFAHPATGSAITDRLPVGQNGLPPVR